MEYTPKKTEIKIRGIPTKANVFCQTPDIFLFGSQSSKLKIRHINVKQLTIKTGISNKIFRRLFFDRKESSKSETINARNELKSANHAKAILDEIPAAKSRKKVLLRFLSGVLISVKTEYKTPKIPRFRPTSSL